MRRRFMSPLLCTLLVACGPLTDEKSTEKVIYGKDGQALPDSQVNSSTVNWRLMSSQNQGDLAFKSVGSWSGSCSATLVAPPGMSAQAIANNKAYILTNGHCIKVDPSAVLVEKSSFGTFTLNMYKDAPSGTRTSIGASLIKYSTMRGTDFALIQLSKTYGEIAALGYQAIALVSTKPASGTPIINIGIPQSGISSQNRYLRRSDCQLEERVVLQEGNFQFTSAIRNRCSVIGGSSGSPLLTQDADGTLTFVAILNTGTSYQSTLQPCAMNNPCEIDSTTGKKATQTYNYGQDIYALAGCFNSEGLFDLNRPSCSIPKP